MVSPPFRAIGCTRRYQAGYAVAAGVYNDNYHLLGQLADADFPRFAVIPALISLGQSKASKNKRSLLKGDIVLDLIGFILRLIPFKLQEPRSFSLRLNV
jgi:hypothetical protein